MNEVLRNQINQADNTLFLIGNGESQKDVWKTSLTQKGREAVRETASTLWTAFYDFRIRAFCSPEQSASETARIFLHYIPNTRLLSVHPKNELTNNPEISDPIIGAQFVDRYLNEIGLPHPSYFFVGVVKPVKTATLLFTHDQIIKDLIIQNKAVLEDMTSRGFDQETNSVDFVVVSSKWAQPNSVDISFKGYQGRFLIDPKAGFKKFDNL